MFKNITISFLIWGPHIIVDQTLTGLLNLGYFLVPSFNTIDHILTFDMMFVLNVIPLIVLVCDLPLRSSGSFMTDKMTNICVKG